MWWSLLFFAGALQGLFIISALWIKQPGNKQAAVLITAFTAVMVLINTDFLYTTSGIYKKFNFPFGISFGTMLLMGPLFFLYTSCILSPGFRFQKKHLLHFLPYCIKLGSGFSFLLIPHETKISIIDIFLEGRAPLEKTDSISLLLQGVHLCIYLFFTQRLIVQHRGITEKETPKSSSVHKVYWVQSLFWLLVLFLLSFISWLAILFINGFYIPLSDYLNTLISSLIIYWVAYRSVLNPAVILPVFKRKSQTTALPGGEAEVIIKKILALMDQKKFFLQPEADIKQFSEELQVPVYLCSRVLNEQFGKPFADFINEYRVEEVKKRLADPAFATFSIIGVALQTGFSSKSSFNAAFKKHTGLTPSAWKRGITDK